MIAIVIEIHSRTESSLIAKDGADLPTMIDMYWNIYSALLGWTSVWKLRFYHIMTGWLV